MDTLRGWGPADVRAERSAFASGRLLVRFHAPEGLTSFPAVAPRFFYGWVVLLAAGLCYGFGMSPAYYSWSIFAPRITADLAIDRAAVGGVFGLFNALHQCVGLFVGLAIARFGPRRVMPAGFCVTAAGLLLLAGAETAFDCYVGFSVLGGIGVGFSTTVPAQTLGQNWFLRRRARVIAAIFTAGGLVGWLVAPADAWILARYDWRTGWVLIAGLSATLGLIAAALVRERPESVGQHLDGAASAPGGGGAAADGADDWTARQAVRTPQFGLMLVCGVAYAAPWNTAVAHLTLHLTDLGHAETAAIGFVGTMALVSIGGRMMGAVGDWVAPQRALAAALALEGLGAGALVLAGDPALALAAVALIGVGFGMAFVCIPVVFSHFFGRGAFAVTSGIRTTCTGVFGGLGPWLAGAAFDATGSYAVPFIGLLALGLAGAAAAAALRRPVPPGRSVVK